MLIRLQYFLNGFFKGCLPLFVPYYLGFGIDLNAIFTMMAIVMALYSLACPTFSVISDATNKIKIFTLVGYSLLAAMFAALHVIDPAANFGLVTTVIVIGYIAFAGCLGLSDKYSNLSCLKSGGDYGKIYIFDPVGILASQVILMVVGEQYVMSLLLMAAILLVLVATWQDYDAILADIQKVPVAEFFAGAKAVVGNREYLTTLVIACFSVGTSVVILQNYLVAYVDELITPQVAWLTGIAVLAVCTFLEVIGAGMSEKIRSKKGFLLVAFGAVFYVGVLLGMFGKVSATLAIVGHFLAVGIGIPFIISYMSRIVDKQYVGTAISLFIAVAIGLSSSLILMLVSSQSAVSLEEGLLQPLSGLLKFALVGAAISTFYVLNRKKKTQDLVADS